MDKVSSTQRSWIMSRVRSQNSQAELVVRRLIYSMGFRYRLHRKDLPGKPDIVLARLKCVIFVNGCFWHQHRCKRGNRLPASNREYWIKKLQRNITRDRLNIAKLKKQGWAVLVVWECQTTERGGERLKRVVSQFLANRGERPMKHRP